MTPACQLKKPLLAAMRADDAEAFRTALNNTGWPSTSPWSDYELLLKAVRDGCKRVAWVLLEKGARVAKKPRVQTPLHEAATRLGWTNFAKVLLERGARVADVNGKGDTALHVAFVHHQSTELVDLLLRAHLRDGAGDVVNRDGLSFLHVACSRPNVRFVKALVEDAKVDVHIQVSAASSSVYAGYTPLHFAVVFGQYGVAEYLLSHHDADVYHQDANGSTTLHLATERGDVRMIDLLLRYDEHREDCYNRFGLSHFMAACAGSDFSHVEDYLRVAAYRSWTEPDVLVRSQVEHRPNYPNAGYTPLHFAAEYGRVDAAMLLLRLGARCCSTTAYDVTPFSLAWKNEHAGVCELFADCCEDRIVVNPAKRRRLEGLGEGRVSFDFEFVDDRKRKGSYASSLEHISCGLVESCLVEGRVVCVDPRQVFQHGDSGAWCTVVDFDSDVSFEEDGSSTGDRLVGAWSFKIDVAADCSSIDVPEDFELDFHEPLDDISDDSFSALNVTSIEANSDEPAVSSSGDLLSDGVENLEGSSSDNLLADNADFVELSSPDELTVFDEVFQSFLREKNFSEKPDASRLSVDADQSGVVDEQTTFDELFVRFLEDASVASNERDDVESSFATERDSSTVSVSQVREIAVDGLETESSDDDLDETLAVTSSSSESDDLEEEDTLSVYSDGSSTQYVMSSGYETDFPVDSHFSVRESKRASVERVLEDFRERYFPVRELTRSSSEQEVEVVFIEVEGFDEHQSRGAIIPEDSAKNDEPALGSPQEGFLSDSSDSGVQSYSGDALDLSMKAQSPVACLTPFRLSASSEQRFFDDRPSITLNFNEY